MTTRLANISIAISTRNRACALANCIEALLAGTVLPMEIVIVDQSTNQQTRSVVEQHQSSVVPLVYVHQASSGLAVSQNTAIKRAKSPIVAVTDDDCIPEPGWVASIEATFGEDDAPDVIAGRVLPLEPEGDKTYPVSLRTSTDRVTFVGKALPWLVGSGNNFALRKELFSSIGGCDERLGPGAPGQGGMDMDLFYRLLRAGARVRYEPNVLVYHERQTKAGRLARRALYGHGMGASFVFWMRQGDLFALRILVHWILFRFRLLLRGVLKRHWLSVYEEWLMLVGTVRGVQFAFNHRETIT